MPAEDPESLAAAVIELLRDTAKRERLGSAARQLVEDAFSAKRMTEEYLRVYEDAIAVAARGHRTPGRSFCR